MSQPCNYSGTPSSLLTRMTSLLLHSRDAPFKRPRVLRTWEIQMPQATGEIHIPEMASGGVWPVRTQAVSYVGSACVVQVDGRLRPGRPEPGAPSVPGPARHARRRRDHRVANLPRVIARGLHLRDSRGDIRSGPPPRPDEPTAEISFSHTGETHRPYDSTNNTDRVRQGRAKTQNYKSTSASESDRIRPELFE
jgi:hypothetical protein